MKGTGMLTLAIGLAVGAAAGELPPKTVEGEVLDLACYMAHEGAGAKHAKCAKQCLVGGSPMGLLTAHGEVLLLVDDHSNKKAYQDAKELAGDKARVTGRMAKRGGLAAIVVDKAEKAR